VEHEDSADHFELTSVTRHRYPPSLGPGTGVEGHELGAGLGDDHVVSAGHRTHRTVEGGLPPFTDLCRDPIERRRAGRVSVAGES
jgi:hypothetical protein